MFVSCILQSKATLYHCYVTATSWLWHTAMLAVAVHQQPGKLQAGVLLTPVLVESFRSTLGHINFCFKCSLGTSGTQCCFYHMVTAPNLWWGTALEWVWLSRAGVQADGHSALCAFFTIVSRPTPAPPVGLNWITFTQIPLKYDAKLGCRVPAVDFSSELPVYTISAEAFLWKWKQYMGVSLRSSLDPWRIYCRKTLIFL